MLIFSVFIKNNQVEVAYINIRRIDDFNVIKLPSNIADIANTAVTLLVLLGVVTDPTTKGLSDSEQALTYHEPKK